MQQRYLTIIIIIFSLNVSLLAKEMPKREMRAVWIASVANIDWPSKSGLSTHLLKEEMLELLDLAKAYKLNTIIFQVRPAADAFYPSALEPWSQWLSGQQGQAPNPFYDPLEFALEECKKRGLELHLWLNPYRAVTDTAKSSVSAQHPIRQHPDWFVTYGKTSYFNPGLPETRNHVSAVVADILKKYKVDAIHFDDYFYPYRISGKEFPDQEAFEKYPRGFLANEKEDWRRDNVDLIIKQLHDTINAIAPEVEFGISPFGVWRNKEKDPRGSDTKAGQTNYDDLYADILKWQQKGWIDYVTPQIYWHIGKEVADYKIIAEWWSNNAYGCRLYIGQAFYRINKKSKDKEWRSANQIIKQIELNRSIPNIDGSMFFSAKSLRMNPLKLNKKLLRKVYNYEALPPVNMRVNQINPESPMNTVQLVANDRINLSWEAGLYNDKFVVYKFRKGKEASIENAENILICTGETNYSVELSCKTNPKKYYFVVSAVSPTNLESVAVPFKSMDADI